MVDAVCGNCSLVGMSQKPFEQWADGRFLGYSDPLDTAAIGWGGGLEWALREIARQHDTDSPVVKNIIKLIEEGQK